MKLRFAKIGLIRFSLLAALVYICIFIAGYFYSDCHYFLITLAMPIVLLAALLDKIFNPLAYTWPLWTNSAWFITLIGFLQWVIFGFVLGLLVDVSVYLKKRVK